MIYNNGFAGWLFGSNCIKMFMHSRDNLNILVHRTLQRWASHFSTDRNKWAKSLLQWQSMIIMEEKCARAVQKKKRELSKFNGCAWIAKLYSHFLFCFVLFKQIITMIFVSCALSIEKHFIPFFFFHSCFQTDLHLSWCALQPRRICTHTIRIRPFFFFLLLFKWTEKREAWKKKCISDVHI